MKLIIQRQYRNCLFPLFTICTCFANHPTGQIVYLIHRVEYASLKLSRCSLGYLKFPVAHLGTSYLLRLNCCSPLTFIHNTWSLFRWHSFTHCKVLLNLVLHVALVKNCLVAASTHHSSLRNFRFKVCVFVSNEAHSETVLVYLLDIGRRHVDRAMERVVFGVNQIQNDIQIAHGTPVRQVYLYPARNSSIKLFYHGRVMLSFTRKVLDTVTIYKSLVVWVEILFAFFRLSAPRVAWVWGC